MQRKQTKKEGENYSSGKNEKDIRRGRKREGRGRKKRGETIADKMRGRTRGKVVTDK